MSGTSIRLKTLEIHDMFFGACLPQFAIPCRFAIVIFQFLSSWWLVWQLSVCFTHVSQTILFNRHSECHSAQTVQAVDLFETFIQVSLIVFDCWARGGGQVCKSCYSKCNFKMLHNFYLYPDLCFHCFKNTIHAALDHCTSNNIFRCNASWAISIKTIEVEIASKLVERMFW